MVPLTIYLVVDAENGKDAAAEGLRVIESWPKGNAEWTGSIAVIEDPQPLSSPEQK